MNSRRAPRGKELNAWRFAKREARNLARVADADSSSTAETTSLRSARAG